MFAVVVSIVLISVFIKTSGNSEGFVKARICQRGGKRWQIQKRKGTFDGTGQWRTLGMVTMESEIKSTLGSKSGMSNISGFRENGE